MIVCGNCANVSQHQTCGNWFDYCCKRGLLQDMGASHLCADNGLLLSCSYSFNACSIALTVSAPADGRGAAADRMRPSRPISKYVGNAPTW